MIAVPVAVFLMGLRHGADPDHLAAIDNLTRNANEAMPRASRFVGTLFAIGHSAMVVGLAILAAAIGSGLGHATSGVERAGAITSIAVLLGMATLNVVMLVRGGTCALRSRFVPRILRDATHPFVAVPTGMLFGLGFETSTQLIAYGAAFTSAHVLDGLWIGLAFCCGMIATDTIDSLLVARVVGTRGPAQLLARRIWIGVVTLVALTVAAAEIAVLVGASLPFDELTLSAIAVAFLLSTALCVAAATRYLSRKAAT